MKKLILLVLFTITLDASGQDLLPAFKNEIEYKGERAFFNGSPFTGVLISETSYKKIGEFNRGFKNSVFYDYYDSGIKKNETTFKDGKKEGSFVEWYENGNKKLEGEYLKDLKHGVFKEYSRDGTLSIITRYYSGVLNGKEETYSRNGSLVKAVSFVNGAKHGKYIEWHMNRNILKEINYQNNKITDSAFFEYDRNRKKIKMFKCVNGEIQTEIFFDNNFQIEYYDYGLSIIESKGIIKNGYPEGEWFKYYRDGKVHSLEFYEDGLKNGIHTFLNERGDTLWHGTYQKDMKNGYGKEWVEDAKYEGKWHDNLRHGHFKEHHPGGITAEGNYEFGIKEGKWLYQVPSYEAQNEEVHQGVFEATFELGKVKEGTLIEWHRNGKLKKLQEVTAGQINGMMLKWHENGQIVSDLRYTNGSINDGKYFIMGIDGDINKEENYQNGKIVSEYSCKNNRRHGPFTEFYLSGAKKIEGTYNTGTRKVEERFGVNKTTNNIIKGTGTLVLIIIVALLGVG